MLSLPRFRLFYGPTGHHVGRWWWETNIEVLVFDGGRVMDGWRGHNLIMDAGKTLLVSALSAGDALIRYCSLGSSNTAVNASQTQLGSEQYRKAVTKFVTGGTGAMQTITYFGPTEANSFSIAEIGWHGGVTATANPNTGTMMARVLYSRTKVATESLQVSRTDTLS